MTEGYPDTTEKQSMKEIAIVDPCGSVYRYTHGSVHVYFVDEQKWEELGVYSMSPPEAQQAVIKLEQDGHATLEETIAPDDVVTV